MHHMMIYHQKKAIKLYLEDIYYITTIPGKPRFLKIVTASKIYETYGKLKDIEQATHLTFGRCHRMCLVNLSHIQAIDKERKQIYFKNNTVAPIGYSRRQIKVLEDIWKTI